jgi:hypothetical protein
MAADNNVMRATDLIANSKQETGHVVLAAADLAVGPHTDGGKCEPGRRRPSLAKELRDAKKAGMSVKGAIVEPGRITLTFGDPASTRMATMRAKRSRARSAIFSSTH